MKYDKDEMFRSAAWLAASGMKVVKVYGVRDDGSCTCAKGRTCRSAGKHPVGDGWQHLATDDENEIQSWFDDPGIDNLRWNIGVRLGRFSGIIDVEADDEKALEVMQRYGLDQIDTIAYRGSRGPHYLFAFEPDLPDTAVVKVDGLEVRLGGGGMAAHSVFPTSWHHTGAQYQWLPGRSPEEVGTARLPEEFKEAILANSKKGGSGVVAQAKAALERGERIREGNRHGHLLGLASWLAGVCRDFTEAEKARILELLRGANMRLEVPKSDDEVRKIVDDQFEHYRTRRTERRAARPLERSGLDYNAETREYDPGEWHLTIVHSQPVQYRLRLPAIAGDGTKPIFVSLSGDDILSARAVAVRVLVETKRLDLQDPNAKRWASIWLGETIDDGNGNRRAVRGLKSKLLATADDEYPPPECKDYCFAASTLSEFLSRFQTETNYEENPKPHADGTPRWIGEKLYFKWWEAWSMATRKGDVTPKSVKMDVRRRVLETVGKDEFDSEASKRFGPGRWIVWGKAEVDALAQIAREG